MPKGRALLIAGIGFCLAGAARAGTAIPAQIQFNRDVQPILVENCYSCHGPDSTERKAGLRLDTKDGLFTKLGKHFPVVAGHPEQSEMIRRITAADPAERMPEPKSGRRLSDHDIAVLTQWIQQGAPWQGHWSFTSPVRPPVPPADVPAWSANPIDHFVLNRLEAEGLKPSPEADKTTLIRRVTLDLTGLPPTPAEVDAFLADRSPDAYEKVVDRLLRDPHYGERMALDWLDAARFADTHGYHIDSGRDMTHWRDWVIRAFNQDMPFDQFTIKQLAGDLLPNATVDDRIASGFNRNSMINFEGGAIPQEYLTAYLIDRVNTTSTVFLGLTLNCCQCHDHKYDPFTQKDYYQLYAFFNRMPENGLDGQTGNAVPVLALPNARQKKEQASLDASIAELTRKLTGPDEKLDAAQREWEAGLATATTKPSLTKKISQILAVPVAGRTQAQKDELRSWYRGRFVADCRGLPGRLTKLRAQRKELEKQIPSTMVMQDMAKPRTTYILERGQYDKFGPEVTANTPASLEPMPAGAPHNRLGLAEWIVDPANPLLARVTVNRAWQSFFGSGIVRTPGDFGTQGDAPSHPELLDWLAVQFRDGDAHTPKWDLRAIVRLIVTSQAYRQSSRATPAMIAMDPEDRLLERSPRFRLPAEFIRDEALAVSGLLNPRIGGPSVFPYQPAGLWEELMSRSDGAKWTAQVYTQSHGPDLYRRSMYTFWKRTSPPPALSAFDAPDREVCTVRRSRTNTPLQALVMWNDPTYVEASRKMAERVMKEAGDSIDDRIAFAFRLATARLPSKREIGVLEKVYDAQLHQFQDRPAAIAKLMSVGESPHDTSLNQPELAAWTMVCSTILNLDETVTRS